MIDKEKQLIYTDKGGFLTRLLASLFDLMLFISIPLSFLFFTDLENKGIREIFILFGGFAILFIVFFHLLSLLYLSLTTSYFGGTIGKLIAGLMVVDDKGKKLTPLRSLFRHMIGYTVSGLFFGLGFLWIIRDSQRQAWHDQVTGSYVIIKNRNRLLPVSLLLILLLFLNSYLVLGIIRKINDNQVLKKELQNIHDSYQMIKNREISPSPYLYQEI